MPYLPNRRILIAAFALTLLFLGVLVGCSNNEVVEAPTATPAPPTPTPLPRGGSLTLRAAADVPDLKPWQPRSRAEEQAIELMYSGLTYLDNTLQPRPDLAQRWDVSADGRLITMTLRPNLNWHDGVALTADDVAYTLGALRVISPTNALLGDLRTKIAEVTVLATNTVELSLTERYAPILADLAVPILPKHLFNGKNIAELNFWDTPIGSGPFKLETRKPGSITFAAHPLFYRGPPLLDRVVLQVTPDAKTAAGALRDNKLLMAELPPDLSPPVTSTAQTLRTGEYAENGYYFLGFNTREGRPFADPQLRAALAAVVDVPQLVREATGIVGLPIGSGTAPGSWADYTPPPTSTADLTRAEKLLDEAGWRLPAGGSVRQREGAVLQATIAVRGDDPRRLKAAEIIAAAGRTVGISLTVQPADFATTIKNLYLPPYDFDLLLGSWSGGAGDPQFGDYLFYDPDDYSLFSSTQINQGIADTRAVLNFTGFNDPVYEQQAIAARQIYDPEERGKSLRRTQQRLNDLRPYLFLWSDGTTTALNNRVATLDGPVDLNTPLYLWNIERWYIAPS